MTFLFEGRPLTGRVNRLTKRVTVLVEDPEGERFPDGRRYRKYYVPIMHLQDRSLSATQPEANRETPSTQCSVQELTGQGESRGFGQNRR